jgi:hypothetical protein
MSLFATHIPHLLTSDYAKPAIGKLESVGAQDISKQSSTFEAPHPKPALKK